MDLVEPGDAAPDAALVDETGAPRGGWRTGAAGSLAVTFVYTRCPLPDFCPLHGSAVRGGAARCSDDAQSAAIGCSCCRSASIRNSIRRRSCANTGGRARRRSRGLELPDRRARDRRIVRRAVRRLGHARRRRPPDAIVHNLQDRGHRRRRHAGDDVERQRVDPSRPGQRSSGVRARSVERPQRTAFTPAERRLIDRLPHARCGAALPERPALQQRTGAARRCGASAAWSATAPRIASRRRCLPR